jgi:zinc transport system permease protein
MFEYQFVQNALMASIMASLMCGVIGVIVVEKKLVMMSGGIAHISYGGVGLGYLLGFEPIIGAFGISVMSAVGIGYMHRKGKLRSDVLIALFWSVGMALGILFIGVMSGYPPDMSSYLFGSILSVTRTDLYLMALFTFIVLLLTVVLFNYWKAYMFDEEFAEIIGVNTVFLDNLLYIMTAMSVVVLIRVVGIVLVLALLTAPAAAASLITKSLRSRMIIAFMIGSIFCFAGLFISYIINVASGASIVITAGLGYAFIYLVTSFHKRIKGMKNI